MREKYHLIPMRECPDFKEYQDQFKLRSESYQRKNLFSLGITLTLTNLLSMTVMNYNVTDLLVYSRKSFSNNTVTLLILTAAFVTGYAYARLSRDEYARRRAYSRYTNLMLVFDEASRKYEYHWSNFIDFCSTFDHTYLFWKYRHQKWAEWKARR